MSRRVKCQLTGAFGTSDTFYRAPNGKYYASEALYTSYKRNAEKREEVLSYFLSEFLAIPNTSGVKIPGFLLKKIKNYESYYGYDVLLDCLRGEHIRIEKAIARIDFSDDVRKISYIFAIVDNYINDYLRRKKAVEAVQKKAALSDTAAPEMELASAVHKEKDISGWLDEEDS